MPKVNRMKEKRRSRAQMGVSGGKKRVSKAKAVAAKKGGAGAKKVGKSETMTESAVDDWGEDTVGGVLTGRVPKGTANAKFAKKNQGHGKTVKPKGGPQTTLSKKQKHVAKYRQLKDDELILKEMGEDLEEAEEDPDL
jgi:hypothetical protein